jgi:hypothetical protein
MRRALLDGISQGISTELLRKAGERKIDAGWATAAVSLGYFLWASISLVEHWVGRISLLLAVALVLVVILRWSYRKAMRTRRD